MLGHPNTPEDGQGDRSVVQVTNDGETFARLQGTVLVQYQTNGMWTRMTEVPIPTRRIAPGVTLDLASDLKRRFPSGRYRLRARLIVDGRQKASLEKEVDFHGDPTVQTALADVALGLAPHLIEVKAMPGSTRSMVVQVHNPGEDALHVRCTAVLPPEMDGVAMGDIVGESFSCAPWVEILPASFTLPAGGRQNLRLIVTVPTSATYRASYYAQLMVRASYLNGQSAGDAQSLVWLRNHKVLPVPDAVPMGVTLSNQGGNSYAVSARYANVGDSHFTPTAVASVTTTTGDVVVGVALETTARTVLPLGTPQFSGVFDSSNIKPGEYLLTAAMDYGVRQKCIQSLPISIVSKGTSRLVTVMERSPRRADVGNAIGKIKAKGR
jgi:hypothetical protein